MATRRAVIRKAESPEDAAERRLAEELVRKLSDMGLSAFQEDALSALSAGRLDGFLAALDWANLVQDWKAIADILADSSKAAGIPALQAAVARANIRVTMSATTAGPSFVMPPRVNIDIAFTMVDERVVAHANARAAELVVQISESLRDTLRQHVINAVSGGMTPQETARTIARIIPLHSRYAQAVIKRERTTFDRLVREGMDATKARLRAAEVADKYAARLTRLRSRTIARTEIMTASNYGQLEGYRSAIETGLMTDPGTGKLLVTKEWITAQDERVCPVCGPLDNMQVDFFEPFPNGGNIPPAHPNCRCSYNVIDNMDQFDYGHGETY